MIDHNAEELVEAYLSIRSERDRIFKEYEAADADLKKDMAEIEALMLSVCNEINADSIKTSQGTLMRRINERYYCSDWDNFKKFILEHKAVDLFEKRIHQGNIKQFLAENSDDGLPPGVNVMREFGITVRKASSDNTKEVV
jgi:hypothetical protein